MGSNGVCFADKSTDELLSEFQHGGAQAPFEEIVRRYAGMVYTVCLQVTRDVHDAEDATQAAFLTLALRAKTADSNIKYLGPWLQKVARRLSLDIMRAKKRRKKREEKRGAMVRELQLERDPRRGLDRSEMADIVRDELSKLPAKYRLPLILHYFGGLRPEEVARELGYKPSTLGVRLHRGRKMLAESLADRGITLTNGMLATVLAGVVHIGVSDNVVASTSLAAAGIGTNGQFVGSLISSRVIALTRQATNALLWAKAKTIVAALLVSTSVLAGTTHVVRKLAPDGLNWRMLDVTRLVQPLLRTLLGRPQFSDAAPAPAPTKPPAPSASHGGGGPVALTLDWLPVSHESLLVEPADDRIGSAGGLEWFASSAPTLPIRGLNDNLFASAGSASIAPPPIRTYEAPPVVARPRADFAPAIAAAATRAATAQDPSAFSGFRLDYANRSIHHSDGLRQFASLVLDSRRAPFDKYVMDGPGARLEANQLIVGDAGRGSFRQETGQVHVDGEFILGNQPGSAGRYAMGPTAQLTARQEYVGLSGAGRVHHRGGTNRAATLSVGHNPGSDGAYALADGELITDRTRVGAGGKGTFEQTGGTHAVGTSGGGDGISGAPGVLSVGDDRGAQGRYVLRGGTITTHGLLVGDAGHGTFEQDGGNLVATNIHVGIKPSGDGTVFFRGGNVQLDGQAEVIVGREGTGAAVIGSRHGAPAVFEQPGNGGANLVVRERATGTGQLSGSGEVAVTGTIVNNGQIIADGYGRARELDLSTASSVTNTIDNAEHNGRTGWFVRRGGKLVLPSIHIASDRTSTWGEDPYDPIPDLVNSVRFTVRDVRAPGEAILSLIAPDNELLPELPAGETFVSIWGFDRKGLDFGDSDLLLRYDDMLVRELGGDESKLRLWIYDEAWSMIAPEDVTADPTLNLLYGHVSGGNFRLFGVSLFDPTLLYHTVTPMSVPEPAGAVMLAGACGALLRRRRRAVAP